MSRLALENSYTCNCKKKAKFKIVIDSGSKETEEWRNVDISDNSDKALDPMPMMCNHDSLF